MEGPAKEIFYFLLVVNNIKLKSGQPTAAKKAEDGNKKDD